MPCLRRAHRPVPVGAVQVRLDHERRHTQERRFRHTPDRNVRGPSVLRRRRQRGLRSHGSFNQRNGSQRQTTTSSILSAISRKVLSQATTCRWTTTPTATVRPGWPIHGALYSRTTKPFLLRTETRRSVAVPRPYWAFKIRLERSKASAGGGHLVAWIKKKDGGTG